MPAPTRIDAERATTAEMDEYYVSHPDSCGSSYVEAHGVKSLEERIKQVLKKKWDEYLTRDE